MNEQNKIYADKSPDWIGKENKLWNIFFPRWWNPLFWTLVFIAPIIDSIDCVCHKGDENGYIFPFFYGLSESAKEVCDFFQKYKV